MNTDPHLIPPRTSNEMATTEKKRKKKTKKTKTGGQDPTTLPSPEVTLTTKMNQPPSQQPISKDENPGPAKKSKGSNQEEPEIINFHPLDRKPAFQFRPSGLATTLPGFLETMKAENEKLALAGQSPGFELPGGDSDQEDSDEEDSGEQKERKAYIEMNLGLGVWEEKKKRRRGKGDGKGGGSGGVDIGGQEEDSESESDEEEEEDESSSEVESEEDSSSDEGNGGDDMEVDVKK